jgi:tetratricopeptide (TPR) repeat protein
LRRGDADSRQVASIASSARRRDRTQLAPVVFAECSFRWPRLESSKATATENIFISYRRDDAPAYAGRIADHLGALIGAHRVFMDVEDIRPGQNFAEAIDQTLAHCSTVLVVVGPRWFEILQQRAAKSQEDYVVHEISAALARKANVVPVFVGGATAAALSGLPAALADLSFHQAVELHDTSFKDDCTRLATSLKLAPTRAFPRPLLWSAAAAVIAIALFLGANAGIGPWRASHERNARIDQLFKTATTQSSQTEYESAFDSYQQILSLDPSNRAALDGQVDAAMLWLENFHVLVGEGQKADDLAGPLLARLKTVLEAGLARTSGRDSRAADILAHLGWAHWLNEKIAFKEFDRAEPVFRQSLAIDSSNVFANSMIGNWLLQTHGDSAAATHHFQIALATGKQRPLVRKMQLGGLMHDDDPGMRVEFAKALNQMRSNNESLDPGTKSRARYLYDVWTSEGDEFREVLAAVPPDENWKTYLWLSPSAPADDYPEFVHASLAEFSGNQAAALSEFKTLLPKLKAEGRSNRMINYAVAAIARLSR